MSIFSIYRGVRVFNCYVTSCFDSKNKYRTIHKMSIPRVAVLYYYDIFPVKGMDLLYGTKDKELKLWQ